MGENTFKNWCTVCQWGGAVACIFFITINVLVLIDYGDEMDRVTCVLRGFSILFALAIMLMSIDCLRNWAKEFLSFAWFLGNWGTRGFFLVYLGVVAASSYAIERETECNKGKLEAHQRLEPVEDWVKYTRYVAGGLLVFFGVMYGCLSCCGGGKDEEEMKQPQWLADKKNEAQNAQRDAEDVYAANNQEMGGVGPGAAAAQPQNVPQQQTQQRTYNYK